MSDIKGRLSCIGESLTHLPQPSEEDNSLPSGIESLVKHYLCLFENDKQKFLEQISEIGDMLVVGHLIEYCERVLKLEYKLLADFDVYYYCEEEEKARRSLELSLKTIPPRPTGSTSFELDAGLPVEKWRVYCGLLDFSTV